MERHLAAILSYDIVGYSRAMGVNEAGTLEKLKTHRREVIDVKAVQHGGRTIKLMGDGALMEFASVVDAVAFAVEMQFALAEHDAGLPEDRRLFYRIGINVGDVIVDGDDIYGDGVNVAARLEGLAEPGGICIRRNVRNQVRGKLNLEFKDLGEVEVKNIDRPIRAFHVIMDNKAAELAAAPADMPPKPNSFARLWPSAAVVALPLILILGLGWWQPWAPDVAPARADRMAFPLPDKPSIAVLPFDNLSERADTDYLSDGLTEDIIANISRIPDLFVVSRESTERYSVESIEPRQAAEELGVRYILTGSLRAQNDRIRVNAQLIDANAGNYVWVERFDRDLTDVLSLQSEIALHVASALFDKVTGLRGLEARTSRLVTHSLEAWELDVRAIALYRKITHESLLQARKLWQRAVEFDPDFAQAWARIAISHMVEARFGWSKDAERSGALAEEHAETALRLDPENVTAHSVLAFRRLYEGEHDAAIAAARRAVAIDPNNTLAMYSLADILRYSGEFKEAIRLIREAIRRNPDHPDWYLYGLAISLYHARRHHESIAVFRKLLERNPEYNFAYSGLAANYVALGRIKEARQSAEMEIKINPRISLDWIRRVVPYRNPEHKETMVQALDEAGIPD